MHNTFLYDAIMLRGPLNTMPLTYVYSILFKYDAEIHRAMIYVVDRFIWLGNSMVFYSYLSDYSKRV